MALQAHEGRPPSAAPMPAARRHEGIAVNTTTRCNDRIDLQADGRPACDADLVAGPISSWSTAWRSAVVLIDVINPIAFLWGTAAPVLAMTATLIGVSLDLALFSLLFVVCHVRLCYLHLERHLKGQNAASRAPSAKKNFARKPRSPQYRLPPKRR